MRIENLGALINANANLMHIAEEKQRKILGLRDWVNGFEPEDPPTQAQLDVKIAKLGMTDLQTAFDNEKAIFIDPDVIPDPVV